MINNDRIVLLECYMSPQTPSVRYPSIQCVRPIYALTQTFSLYLNRKVLTQLQDPCRSGYNALYVQHH